MKCPCLFIVTHSLEFWPFDVIALIREQISALASCIFSLFNLLNNFSIHFFAVSVEYPVLLLGTFKTQQIHFLWPFWKPNCDCSFFFMFSLFDLIIFVSQHYVFCQYHHVIDIVMTIITVLMVLPFFFSFFLLSTLLFFFSPLFSIAVM